MEAIKIAEKDLDNAIFLIQQSVVADPKNAKLGQLQDKFIYLMKIFYLLRDFIKKQRHSDPLLMDVKDLNLL